MKLIKQLVGIKLNEDLEKLTNDYNHWLVDVKRVGTFLDKDWDNFVVEMEEQHNLKLSMLSENMKDKFEEFQGAVKLFEKEFNKVGK